MARKSFAFLKWPQPMKPECAPSGDGWDVSRTRSGFSFITFSFIRGSFLLALFPQSKNTVGVFVLHISIIELSVNISQPLSLWESGLSFSTVRIVFSKKTPCFARKVKSPSFLLTYYLP